METIKSAHLEYSDLKTCGSSNKQYRLFLMRAGQAYSVSYQNGPIGGTLTGKDLNPEPLDAKDAEKLYEKKLHEKLSKGYVPAKGANGTIVAPTPVNQPGKPIAGRTRYPVELLEEIDREEADLLVKDPRYIMQIKLDGHRRQAEKLEDGRVISYNKLGLPKPFPPEVEAELAALKPKSFLFDGELVGNAYIVFDVLQKDDVDFAPLPYEQRLSALLRTVPRGTNVTAVASWETTAEKKAGLKQLFKNRCEGAVFKLRSAPYAAGRHGHKKLKFTKSCTCKILALGTKGHDNATLGLFDGLVWQDVGGASMIGKDKRIKVGSLVEIKFLYATDGRRLYQPRLVGIRTDQTEADCTFKQLKNAYKEGVTANA